MSDYSVIAELGDSLLSVLFSELNADSQISGLIDSEDRISLESPADLENNNSVRLSMYLYRILENPYMKNRFPVEGTGGKSRKPPLTLDLYYLLTPLVGTPREQMIVLGKTMQILYDPPHSRRLGLKRFTGHNRRSDPISSESSITRRTNAGLAGVGNSLPPVGLLSRARDHFGFGAGAIRTACRFQAHRLRNIAVERVAMASVNMAVPDVSELSPPLVLLLWDGFTGSNVMAGDIIVQVGATKPQFQLDAGQFVFGAVSEW